MKAVNGALGAGDVNDYVRKQGAIAGQSPSFHPLI